MIVWAVLELGFGSFECSWVGLQYLWLEEYFARSSFGLNGSASSLKVFARDVVQNRLRSRSQHSCSLPWVIRTQPRMQQACNLEFLIMLTWHSIILGAAAMMEVEN